MSHKLLSFLTFITWFGQSRKLQCYGKNISTVTSDYEESGTTNAPVSSPLKKLVELCFTWGRNLFPLKAWLLSKISLYSQQEMYTLLNWLVLISAIDHINILSPQPESMQGVFQYINLRLLKGWVFALIYKSC